jgi:serine/threonine protein kinase
VGTSTSQLTISEHGCALPGRLGVNRYKNYAIKILREEVLKDKKMLSNFKQGIFIQKMITEYKVDGVVKYQGAFNIPASIVMDFVDGYTLKEFHKIYKPSFEETLLVLSRLSEVIESCHKPPKNILHRDIKPGNVMISDWGQGDDWQLSVLDFDLSYYRDSINKLTYVPSGHSSLGYIAPELLDGHKDGEASRARSALVDSFGFGMTALFMLSGKEPGPSQHRELNWEDQIYSVINSIRDTDSLATKFRLANLIIESTKHDQNERISFFEIFSQLAGITIWEKTINEKKISFKDCAHDQIMYFCEELFFRSFLSHPNAKWDFHTKRGSVILNNGGMITLEVDNDADSILIKINKTITETSDRRTRGDYLTTMNTNIINKFRHCPHEIRSSSVFQGGLSISIGVSFIESNFKQMIQLSAAIEAITSTLN